MGMLCYSLVKVIDSSTNYAKIYSVEAEYLLGYTIFWHLNRFCIFLASSCFFEKGRHSRQVSAIWKTIFSRCQRTFEDELTNLDPSTISICSIIIPLDELRFSWSI